MKEMAINYANALAARISREITGPNGHVFSVKKKMMTKEGGFGVAFASETLDLEYVIRVNPGEMVSLSVYDKEGNRIRKSEMVAKNGAAADVQALWGAK